MEIWGGGGDSLYGLDFPGGAGGVGKSTSPPHLIIIPIHNTHCYGYPSGHPGVPDATSQVKTVERKSDRRFINEGSQTTVSERKFPNEVSTPKATSGSSKTKFPERTPQTKCPRQGSQTKVPKRMFPNENSHVLQLPIMQS